MRIYGRNPVLERLKTNPQSIKKLFVQEGHPETGYVQKKARKHGIPMVSVPYSKILKLARNVNTQGILAETSDFAYVPFGEMAETALSKGQTLVFLDGLNDPQNLGSIIRGLSCLGGFGIVIPKHDSVDVTESVLRVASGADNFISVSRVSNLTQAIDTVKEAGFWAAGAVVEGGQDVRAVPLPFPLALVVGSEQKGIRDVVKKHLDVEVTIPMAHPRLSLNVAQATLVMAYEIFRQKRTSAAPSRAGASSGGEKHS
ncbi:MAG: RNA methyltransferase [Candidatus Omnitrophota bacterium]|nr:RNA methyltransferase [Candidatus Omnitrophota bacterium]MDZ4241458.1 RNA methyltransferase [Candidatus Omnitrophota bacterium]